MSNQFLISGSINNKRVHELHTFLAEASRSNTIEVLINSPGGDESCGRALAGLIMRERSTGRRINTLGFGDIQSAAVIVFAAGEKRKLSKFATVMVHESSQEGGGNSSFFKKTAKQMESDEKFWCELLQQLTGTDSKVWLKLHEDETYLRPEDALKLNLATELV